MNDRVWRSRYCGEVCGKSYVVFVGSMVFELLLALITGLRWIISTIFKRCTASGVTEIAGMRIVCLFVTVFIALLGAARQVSADPPADCKTPDQWLGYLMDCPDDMPRAVGTGTLATDEYLKKIERYMQRRLGPDCQAMVLWGPDAAPHLGPNKLGCAGPCKINGKNGFVLLFKDRPTQLTALHELGHFHGQFLRLFRAVGYDEAVSIWNQIGSLSISESSMTKSKIAIGGLDEGIEMRSVQDLLSSSRRWNFPERPGAYSCGEKAAQTLYALSCGISEGDDSALRVQFEKPDPMHVRGHLGVRALSVVPWFDVCMATIPPWVQEDIYDNYVPEPAKLVLGKVAEVQAKAEEAAPYPMHLLSIPGQLMDFLFAKPIREFCYPPTGPSIL